METISAIHVLLIYVAGIFVTLLILKLFGKKLIYDYDKPRSYIDPDSYSSNTEAYLMHSLAWVLFWFMVIALGIWSTLLWITKNVFKI